LSDETEPMPRVNVPVEEGTTPGATSATLDSPNATTASHGGSNRESVRHCDYPLFWAVQRVVEVSNSPTQDESLRRLPGTAGRVSVASVPCPSCVEPNPVTAENCLRCGNPMRPEVEPPPAPVSPSIPAPEPEKKKSYLWLWILIAVVTTVLAAGAAWAAWGTPA
jgi:hypothetical protein